MDFGTDLDLWMPLAALCLGSASLLDGVVRFGRVGTEGGDSPRFSGFSGFVILCSPNTQLQTPGVQEQVLLLQWAACDRSWRELHA
jgi:hypothetical protein